MTTTLALADANNILMELMTTRDKTKCAQCHETLVGDSYNICRFPDAAPGTRGLPEEHEGHTVCKGCADTLAYIGEAGCCGPCFLALGPRRRSSIKLAGVALRPPVKNSLANTMIKSFNGAKQSITEVQERQDRDRIQEGADRRAAAVEDVRRRREEAEVEAKRLEDEAKAEAKRLEDEAKTEAKRLEDEAKTEAKRLGDDAKAEAKRLEDEAKERLEREDTLRARRITREDRERVEKQKAEDEARRIAAQNAEPKTRKRKAVDPEVLAERKAKRDKTREDNKYKLDNFDRMREENERLTHKMDILMSTTADFVGKEAWENDLSRFIHNKCIEEGVEEEEASEVEEIDDDEEDQEAIRIVD